jgi:hypothetical protein
MSKNDLHDKIVDELYQKYGVSKYEINKVISSQWRLIERTITNKECKVINCIFLGKFYPTAFRRKLEERNNESKESK